MRTALTYFLDLGTSAAALVAIFSMLNAWHLGRQASSHLSRAESDNYLRNLLLLAPKDAWALQLLKGRGEELHRRALVHVRRCQFALLAFVGVVAIGVAASWLLGRET